MINGAFWCLQESELVRPGDRSWIGVGGQAAIFHFPLPELRRKLLRNFVHRTLPKMFDKDCSPNPLIMSSVF